MFLTTILCLAILFGGGHFAKIDECNPPPEVSFRFLDSSAKLPSGFMSGNLVDMGAFDQCLAIDQTAQDIRYRGRYCLIKIPLPTDLMMARSAAGPRTQLEDSENRAMAITADGTGTMGILLGWCIPDKCPLENITAAIKKMINLAVVIGKLPPQLKNITFDRFLGGFCQSQEDMERESSTWSSADLGTVGFLGAIGCIMVLSTVYDLIIRYLQQKPAHIILVAFSVRTNGEKLLAVSHNPDQLPCLHGIRFISMMWIIYGHRFTVTFMEALVNSAALQTMKQNVENMYVVAGPVSVDTFFFLSGLLVAYGFFLAKSKGVKFNIIMYWLHRYIRLTPALAVVILVHSTILNRLGSGPFWPFTVTVLKDTCAKNWWQPLIYIQNYYNGSEMCLGQSWYLSIDTQLFFLSPIILIPLWRWPKNTLIALVALFVGSIISPFVVSYHFDMPVSIVETVSNLNYMDYYYYATHTRYGPWLIGIIMGYFLFKIKSNKATQIHLSGLQALGGWLVSGAVMLTIIFAQHNLLDKYDRVGNAFFNGLHRHVWALCLCWIVYACTQGYGGPINTFLSWTPFQILGRFTYTMYLTHLTLQYLIAGSNRTNTFFSQFNNMYRFWGDFFITLFIAVLLSLSFESPMLTIEKVIFKTGGPAKKPKLQVNQNQAHHTITNIEANN
ncbi:uncharacterized protein CBL_01428 [Carabus blaptoides fortunei]